MVDIHNIQVLDALGIASIHPHSSSARVSLKDWNIISNTNTNFKIIIPNQGVVKNLFPDAEEKVTSNPNKMTSVRNPKTKGPKEEEMSPAEMDKYLQGKGVSVGGSTESKKTRRIACRLTGQMITSEQYHANVKAGKYAHLPPLRKGPAPKGKGVASGDDSTVV